MATQANDFWKKLFSVRGRSGRKRFWMTVLLQFVALLIGGGFILALSSAELPWASVPLGAALILGSFALSLCNSIKRLHDIGYSGWWLAPMFLVSLLLGLAGLGAASAGGGEGASNIGGGFDLICLILMGALPGTNGPNKFGDPPGEAVGPPVEPAAQSVA